MSENYDLVYQSRRKVEIYRDTGVSKNVKNQIFPKKILISICKWENLQPAF
jgi:hypothetical protein